MLEDELEFTDEFKAKIKRGEQNLPIRLPCKSHPHYKKLPGGIATHQLTAIRETRWFWSSRAIPIALGSRVTCPSTI